MKKYDALWNDLNTLLTFLRGTHLPGEEYATVRLVREYFAQYGNSAPPELLRRQIDKIQEYLDNAEE